MNRYLSSFFRSRTAGLTALVLVTSISAAHANPISVQGNMRQTLSSPSANFADIDHAKHYNPGYTGWRVQTFSKSSTEGPSFLAVGSINNGPSTSLLNDVTTTSVPELGTLGMMLTGLAGLGGFIRTRLMKLTNPAINKEEVK